MKPRNRRLGRNLPRPVQHSYVRCQRLRRRQQSKAPDNNMNKDRVIGLAKQAISGLKQVGGNAVGDTTLQVDGTGDEVEDKLQNAVGRVEDAPKR